MKHLWCWSEKEAPGDHSCLQQTGTGVQPLYRREQHTPGAWCEPGQGLPTAHHICMYRQDQARGQSPHSNHAPVAKIPRLWTWPALSLGDPVKHHFQLLQEKDRQKSMCSHSLSPLSVSSPPPSMHCVMPHENLCFQSVGHSLIHSNSQQESLLWLLASICFIYGFDKNTMCSQSGYPSIPCELGEGRDHQPVPYSHPSLLPKAPSHDNLYPWGTSLTQQRSRQWVSICCRFHVLYYQEKWTDRQITSQVSYRFF